MASKKKSLDFKKRIAKRDPKDRILGGSNDPRFQNTEKRMQIVREVEKEIEQQKKKRAVRGEKDQNDC